VPHGEKSALGPPVTAQQPLGARHGGALGLPQAVLDGEGVNGGGQVLGVHRGETLRAGVVLEELVAHGLRDAARAGAVQALHLVAVGRVGVQAAELAARVPEQEQEVRGLRARDLLHHSVLAVLVHGAGKHAELHGVEHDRPIGLDGRLLVEAGAIEVHGGGGGGDVAGAVVEGGGVSPARQAGRQRAGLRAAGRGRVAAQPAVRRHAVQQALVLRRPAEVASGAVAASGGRCSCRASSPRRLFSRSRGATGVHGVAGSVAVGVLGGAARGVARPIQGLGGGVAAEGGGAGRAAAGRRRIGQGVGGAARARGARQGVRGAPAALRGARRGRRLRGVGAGGLQHGAGAGAGAGLGPQPHRAGARALLLLLVQQVPGRRLVVPPLFLRLLDSLLDLVPFKDHLPPLPVFLFLSCLPLLLLLLHTPLGLRLLLLAPPRLLLLLLAPQRHLHQALLLALHVAHGGRYDGEGVVPRGGQGGGGGGGGAARQALGPQRRLGLHGPSVVQGDVEALVRLI